jgi:K+-sensing histidine kinase KdpD
MTPGTDDPLRRLRHDLANPLAAILAEVQLLLLNAERYDEETSTSLREIEKLARRMRDMLQKPATPQS